MISNKISSLLKSIKFMGIVDDNWTPLNGILLRATRIPMKMLIQSLKPHSSLHFQPPLIKMCSVISEPNHFCPDFPNHLSVQNIRLKKTNCAIISRREITRVRHECFFTNITICYSRALCNGGSFIGSIAVYLHTECSRSNCQCDRF